MFGDYNSDIIKKSMIEQITKRQTYVQRCILFNYCKLHMYTQISQTFHICIEYSCRRFLPLNGFNYGGIIISWVAGIFAICSQLQLTELIIEFVERWLQRNCILFLETQWRVVSDFDRLHRRQNYLSFPPDKVDCNE